MVYAIVYPEADYFALTQYSEDYDYGEETVWMTYWHGSVFDGMPGRGPPAPAGRHQHVHRRGVPHQDGH